MATAARADLINRAQAGDRSAFDSLVGPLVDQAFRLAFGMLHNREAAEDAVQEAAMKAWRRLGNLRPGAEMRPWFLGIVANQCRSTARGRWWSVSRLDDEPEPSERAFEDEVLRGADIRAALRRLPPDHREVLVLRYYLDLPIDEVAAVLGVAEGTVKSRVNRALAGMRPHLQRSEVLV